MKSITNHSFWDFDHGAEERKEQIFYVDRQVIRGAAQAIMVCCMKSGGILMTWVMTNASVDTGAIITTGVYLWYRVTPVIRNLISSI